MDSPECRQGAMEFEGYTVMINPSQLIRLIVEDPSKRLPWLSKRSGQLCIICGILIAIFFVNFLTHYIEYSKNIDRLISLQGQYKILDTNQLIIKQYDDTVKSTPGKLQEFKRKRLDSTLTLDDLKTGINKLQRSLKLQFITCHFSNVFKNPEFDKLSTVKVDIDLKTLHDKQLFTFIEKMQKELPGVIQIQDVKIKRTSPLTPEMVESAQQNNKVVLFDGHIIILWSFPEGHKA